MVSAPDSGATRAYRLDWSKHGPAGSLLAELGTAYPELSAAAVAAAVHRATCCAAALDGGVGSPARIEVLARDRLEVTRQRMLAAQRRMGCPGGQRIGPPTDRAGRAGPGMNPRERPALQLPGARQLWWSVLHLVDSVLSAPVMAGSRRNAAAATQQLRHARQTRPPDRDQPGPQSARDQSMQDLSDPARPRQ